MIDIEKLKPLIVERLMPLKPDKIILFGSFAYATPNENNDLDICIIKKDYVNKEKIIILDMFNFFYNIKA